MIDTNNVISPRLRMAALLARCATVLLLVVMFIFTHYPMPVSPGITISDKLVHFVAFLTLTFMILLSWELSAGVLQPKHYFVVWLVTTLYGALDEITQIPVGRVCDGLDWLADVVGIVAGLIIYQLLRLLWVRWL